MAKMRILLRYINHTNERNLLKPLEKKKIKDCLGKDILKYTTVTDILKAFSSFKKDFLPAVLYFCFYTCLLSHPV